MEIKTLRYYNVCIKDKMIDLNFKNQFKLSVFHFSAYASPSSVLYVSNLPYSVTDEGLMGAFIELGNKIPSPVKARVIMEGDRSRG